MKVTDNNTGCRKDYKSQRYIITSQKPEIWVGPNKTSICVGEDLSFDVVFDAHVADYNTSWLPSTVTANYVVKAPVGPLYEPQPLRYGVIELKLVNSSGLYKGNIKVENYFIQNTYVHDGYKFSVSLSSNTIPVNNGSVDYTNSSMLIVVHKAENRPSKTTCVLFDAASFYQITLGMLPCTQGVTTMSSGYEKAVISGTSIEILPEAGIELFATEPGTGYHLYIIDCISQQIAPPSEDRSAAPENENLDALLPENRPDTINISNPPIQLEVFPNPFTGQVTIRYTVPPNCPGDVALYLRDFTGRQIKTIERRANAAPGAYQAVFDGSGLPSGIYLYELVVCNGAQVVKKAEKISH